MTKEGYLEVYTRAWEDFEHAKNQLEQRFDSRLFVLRGTRDKIISTALAELQKTEEEQT